MGRSFSVKIEGLKDLDRALGELGKTTGRNVMRRAGIEALEPMAADAASRAPHLFGNLKESITATTRKPSRHRKESEVEVYMGPNRSPAAHLQEFGAKQHGPQPYMRPAWDAGKAKLLDDVADKLGGQIMKAAERQARKAARLAAKTGG